MQKKLFVGYRITPDLKAELYGQMKGDLQEIPYQGKDYIGCYITTASPSISEIRRLGFHITTILQTLCPDHRIDTLSLFIFPQAFIG